MEAEIIEASPMKVVILCGGMGTRIRDHHETLPKPMIPIGGKPILWHIMKFYAHFGFKDFVLCLGYKREAFVDFFLHYRYHNSDLTIDLSDPEAVHFHEGEAEAEDWRITLVDTGLRTNTGGRLRQAAKYITGNRFMLTYGDGLGTVNLHELVEFHKETGRLATVSAVHPAGRFGEIELDDHLVSSFAEKPQTTEGYINGGFMVLEKDFVPLYLERSDCVLEADALGQCSRDGQLAAYCHEGFWQCMDTSREHQILEDLWSSGEAPWKVWQSNEREHLATRLSSGATAAFGAR
jgi:glucose-1-phosphate cytidylyltransferase